MSKITLYKTDNNNKAEQIKEKPFKLEKEIQRVFENNLQLIMGLQIVKSEFTIKDRRIDTLAYDPQSKAFVIIEYKLNKNHSVVDQGMTYLSLMLQNKADFVLEYYEVFKKNLPKNEIDWSQSRVVFVSTDFTEFQIEAANFKDLAIELWEIKRYDNNTLAITSINKSKAAQSIKPFFDKNKGYKDVTNEIKVYTEEDHLQGKSDEIVELYERFKLSILNLTDDIEIKPSKLYISFKKNGSNIVDIEIKKTYLKLYINMKKGELDDPKKIMRDISNVGHWGNGDYQTKIFDTKDIEYIMSLVKQAIK